MAVKTFYENGGCALVTRREYRCYFNVGRHDHISPEHAIRLWLKNFEATGSALKQKPTYRPQSIRRQETIQKV